MPFCSSCGNQVDGGHAFCAKCGARQPAARQTPIDPLGGITPRTASILCYIPWIGWVGSVIVLASERFRTNRAVRFHAFQGLYLFVAMLLVEWVLTPMFRVIHEPIFRFDKLLQAGILFMCVFMIIKASHEEMYSLPIIGDLAARSAAEN